MRKPSNTFYIVIFIFSLGLCLSGCKDDDIQAHEESSSKLPKIAIVSLSFQFQPTPTINSPPHPQKINLFFDSLSSKLKNTLKNEIHTIEWIDIDDIYLADAYQTLPNTVDPATEVSPVRYRNIQPTVHQAMALCEETHVDVLMMIQFKIDTRTQDIIVILQTFNKKNQTFKTKTSVVPVTFQDLTDLEARESYQKGFLLWLKQLTTRLKEQNE